MSADVMNAEAKIKAASALLMLFLCAAALLVFGAPDQKRISIYSNVANYALPVVERGGVDYVGLLEVLDPLGAVSAKTKGERWNLRYNDVEAEFTDGRTRAKVHGKEVELNADFLLENGRGLVPLSSLTNLLPRILEGPVTYHDLSRRLFIGSVAVHFTAQVNKADPSKLVVNFSSPVNPMIATEPGKLRMTFTHEPVLSPGSTQLTFDSKTTPSATFQEGNGAAEIVVNGTSSLIASFSNDRRTITISPPTPLQTQVRPPQKPNAAVVATSAAPPTNAQRHYFVVVDAAHGGDDRGATLSDQLVEKDITLAFARRIRQELESRGMTALLLRDGDTTLSLDQRAATTNSVHPALYICIHAASEGNGVRLYSAMLPSGGGNRGIFVDWNTAQSSFTSGSQNVLAGWAAALQHTQLPIRSAAAPLRPLNNITVPAVAVEIAPPGKDVSELNSATYQQSISAAVALGVSSLRGQLGAP